MKNYDELTNRLLQRRDQYMEQKAQRKKAVMGIAVPLCCFCTVALLGFGAWKGGLFSPLPPAQIPDNPTATTAGPTLITEQPADSDRIVVHPISSIRADYSNISLMVQDFVEMTREEMIRYYGVDYVPEVPSDIKAWEDQLSGIYRRNGGIGEVYWDADVLNYSNEDFSRNVHLQVDKGSNVFTDTVFYMGTEARSVISNVEILIGQTENGWYYAEFMYKNVGFLLSADGVTEAEFVSIIKSIVQ